MNNITIAGRLTKDAELRHTPNGDAVCSFSVADDQGKDKKAIFWSASLWGKRAESLAQYLLKGSSVTVSGSVNEREYQDRDGVQRKAMEVRVNDIALQGGKPQQQGGEPTQAPRAAPAPAPAAQRPAPAATRGSGFDDLEDDIPFITASPWFDMTPSKQRRMARYDF